MWGIGLEKEEYLFWSLQNVVHNKMYGIVHSKHVRERLSV